MTLLSCARESSGAFVGAGPIRRAQHPRPLRATATRNPTKTKNNFATPVGADRCVGPLRTCCFRSRAHTQVRPYKVGMGSLIDHTSEPGGPPPTGGLNCKAKHRRAASAKRSGCGHWPPHGLPRNIHPCQAEPPSYIIKKSQPLSSKTIYRSYCNQRRFFHV